jgi:cytochrome P450
MFLGIGDISVFATVTTIIFFFFRWMRSGKGDAGKHYPPRASALSLLVEILRTGVTALPCHAMKSAEKLGPVISYNLGGRLVVMLNGKEAISNAFLRKSEAFADRNSFWTEANITNRDLQGIIFARFNDVFKKNHKLCLTILKEFGFGVNSISEIRILREAESMIQKILKHNGLPFNPKPMTASTTFSVVGSILFGHEFVASGKCEGLLHGIEGFTTNSDFLFDFAPYLRFLPNFRRKISTYTQCNNDMLNAIEKGIEYSRSNESEPTFVRRFIEIQGSNYDHQDLVFIVRDICLGGSETVSTTLQWAMVELANHPEVQTRFQREIDDVVPKERLPSLDDKSRLPYTEAVILEVMRRRTVIPMYVPHAALRDTEVHGYFIPKGCMVLGNGVSVHMDPKTWKDPDNFRPERFIGEDQKIIGSENVIPFSLGKRSCLGEVLGRQKTFLFLTSLVQHFDIQPPEGQELISVKEVILGSLQPTEFKVRLVPRMKAKN